MKKIGYICLSMICLFLQVQAQQIIFTPKWTAQAQFTGYYVADKLGFYKAEGLDVKIQHPSISESSFSVLEQGRAQIVVMNLSYALTAKTVGTNIVNIMQTSQTNSLMLVSHTPFKGVHSIQNKAIAVWNHLDQNLLDLLSQKYNLNAKWIRFNSGVNLFLSKAVGICLVGSYNEFPQLAEFGMKISPDCVLRLSDYGYNLPEDGLYVTEEYYTRNKAAINKFVYASMKGWIWASENMEKALDIVMEEIRKNNVGTNRYHQHKMLEEIIRLQHDKNTGKRTFKLSREGFDRAANLLLSNTPEPDRITYKNFVK